MLTHHNTHWLRVITLLVAGILALFLGAERAASRYADVPPSSWYAPPVESFLSAGYLRSEETRFRPADTALRLEFIELIVAIHGGSRIFPSTASFDDVPSDAQYFSAFEDAAREGWVRGDSSCFGRKPCFARPFAKVNRAEAAALIVRAFGLVPTNDASQFKDNLQGEWYALDIQTAADHCILQGDSGSANVRPADGMNRAEMVAMLDRARQRLVYGIDCGEKKAIVPRVLSASTTSPTTADITFSVDLNPGSVEDPLRFLLTNGLGSLVVGSKLTNGNVVQLTFSKPLQPGKSYNLAIRSMLTKEGKEFEDVATLRGYLPMTIEEETGLSVSLVGALPGSDGLPRGAIGVRMMALTLAASCAENVSVESLTLVRDGQGSRADILGLYAVQNGRRISRKRIIASDKQEVEMRFTRTLLIPACEKFTIDILADFSSSAATSARHSFALLSPGDVKSTSMLVRGSFPLRGPQMRVAAVSAGTVTVDFRPVSPNEVSVGDSAAVISKFQLSANGVEHQDIRSMLFKQEGSASDGDLLNLRIRRSDKTVLSKVVPRTVNDYAFFVFDPPLRLLQSDKVTLEIAADVIGGASDTVRMRLEEEGDVYAVGSRFGKGSHDQLFGSQIVISTQQAAPLVSIDAGSFTMETDGPSTRTYAPDTRDALLANLRFTSGSEAADIKSLYILVQGQTKTGNGFGGGSTVSDEIAEVLDSVRMRNPLTGNAVGGVRLTGGNDSATSTAKTYQIYRFDDFVIRGAQTWELRANFKDNGRSNHPMAGDRFRVILCAEPIMIRSGTSLVPNPNGCTFGSMFDSPSKAYQMRIRGLTTGRDIGDIRPRGTITGNFHVIEAAKLSVSVRSTGASDSAVRGTKGISLLQFEATSGLAKGVLLRKLIFDAAAGSLLNAQNYSLIVDANNDGFPETILEKGVASQAGKIIFGKIVNGGFLLTEKTTLFEVRADIASSLASSTLQLRFAVNDANFIEVEEEDRGSSLAGINTNGFCSLSHCDIVLTTASAKLFTFLDQGSLFVSKSTIPTRSRQLLGGTTGDAVLRLRFRALNEDIDVTDLQISSSGSTASSADRLELFRDGEPQPFGFATVGACGGDDALTIHPIDGAAIQTFCAKFGSRQLVIQSGQQVDVLIRPRIKTDAAGGVTGQTIQLWLTGQAVSNFTSGSGAVRARGLQSSFQLVANDGNAGADGEIFLGVTSPGANQDIIGNVNVVTMAKIVKIENANPDPQGSLVRSGIQSFGQFRFTASSNTNSRNGANSATIDKIIFSVSASNVTLDASSFKVSNKADASVTSSCAALTTAGATISGSAQGAFYVQCTGLRSSSVNTTIGSGESLTLVLEGTVTNPAVLAAGSSLQASLDTFSSLVTAIQGFGATASHIHWLDEDGSGSTDFYWIEYPETEVRSTGYRM